MCEVLGHFVPLSGSVSRAWGEVNKFVWRSYFAKFKPAVLRLCSSDGVLSYMDRHLLPILTYRCCIWPFSKSIADEIDAFQARLLGPLLDVRKTTDETIEEFVRRRCRRANTLTDDYGRWSAVWARRVLTFDAHIERDTSGILWGALLRPVRDAQWLMNRRSQYGPLTLSAFTTWTATAGRTNTRAAKGGVAIRWHKGVRTSREFEADDRLRQALSGRRPRRSTALRNRNEDM